MRIKGTHVIQMGPPLTRRERHVMRMWKGQCRLRNRDKRVLRDLYRRAVKAKAVEMRRES